MNETPLILAGGIVLGAIILSISGCIVAWMILERRRHQERYDQACEDVAFLQAVEDAHCAKLKDETGESHLMRIRTQVHTETGFSWSGQHTKKKQS
jgi:hypothetical protein